VAKLHLDDANVVVSFRTVGVAALRGDVLFNSPVATLPLLLGQTLLWHCREGLRRLEPHVSDGIIEERQQVQAHGCGRARISLRDGSANKRIGVVQQPPKTFALGGVRHAIEASDRACPRYAWARAVVGQRQQLLACARRADGSRLQNRGELLEARVQSAIPRFYLIRGPLRRLISVAATAGVGRAQGDAEVGARDTHAVIAARIDDHIGAGRHVARHALRASRLRLVPMVGGDIVFFRRMALETDPIAGGAQLQAVGIVAIAAGYAGMEHAALQEGPVFIDFVANLAIRKVKTVVEQRDAIAIAYRRSGRDVGPDRSSTR